MQESPGLNPDFEISSRFQWKKKTCCCIATFQKFSHILKEVKLVYSSLLIACRFFMNRNNNGFFSNFEEKSHALSKLWSPKDLLIELPQIFNMRILIMSWPWALLGSKLLIILPTSLSVNMFEKDLSLKSSKSVGSTLLFCTDEHWLAKEELNNSAFSLKSVINLFWWKTDGIQGTFLPVKKHFKIDQQVFELILVSNKFWQF